MILNLPTLEDKQVQVSMLSFIKKLKLFPKGKELMVMSNISEIDRSVVDIYFFLYDEIRLTL